MLARRPAIRFRLLGGLAAPVAGALALAACGGGATAAGTGTPAATPHPSAAAKAAVGRATARTAAASARVEVRVVLRRPGASRILAYDAKGVVAPGGGRLRIDRTSIGDEVANEIFIRRNGGLVLYTTSAATRKTLPKGKTWLEVDMARFGRQRYGADTAFLAGADQDPLQALLLLRSPAARVTDLGADWLPDRTRNTHYRGTVNLAAAVTAAGASAKGLETLRTDLGNPTQTIDVWVNGHGSVARIVVKGPEKTPVGTLSMQETTDFTDYGTKAGVSPPPASKTADYFTLAK